MNANDMTLQPTISKLAIRIQRRGHPSFGGLSWLE